MTELKQARPMAMRESRGMTPVAPRGPVSETIQPPDERVVRLSARRERAARMRGDFAAKRKRIVTIADAEQRKELTDREDAEFFELTRRITDLDKEIREYDERLSELSDELTAHSRLTPAAELVKRSLGRASVHEHRTYAQGNHEVSYVRDLMRHSLRMDADGQSAERLLRHAQEVAQEPEYRDLLRTDGNGGYFVPPAWLTEQFADLIRGGRVTADLCYRSALPGGTDSINIPKIATGTTAVIQTADNQAVSETDLTDAAVTAGVKTIAGQQDVAVQLLDQSPLSFDEVIMRDLLADYTKNLDIQVINGSNGSGQVKGILGATGINAVTYTDTSPTVAELYPKLADAVNQAATGSGTMATAIVMHPRRWAWFLTALDTTNRPLVVPSGPGQNQIATGSGMQFQGLVGNLFGVPVYTDPNIPTNLGSGTNEDRILVMKADENYLYESSVRTRVLPEVGSGTLTVRLQVYGYIAFTAERRPAATSVISGTGLVAPTF
ncbi:MAG TPA: phage major capsid protein [Nocardioides sp.]|uniref:phage major capsid protein n=1 Tax=uncultured Nocardioides sp. TaxID=198441 RepID=UPI00260CD9D8|nr:phage major capsid protein [uncultured Nocardioides sp.]HRD60457.1 phage major capsid protein [Nocardioides sp.]HRI94070.1 phage major capsid protein [Nocardioides sp.]HRK44123.1 phage major capsid protein [Nocardioides sp.]